MGSNLLSSPSRHRWAAVGAAAIALAAIGGAPPGAEAAPLTKRVVVSETTGSGTAPERAVVRLGGRVERQLPLIDGFAARMPEQAVAALRALPGVRSVTLDRPFHLRSDPTADDAADPGASLAVARATIGADGAPGAGSGVDVALIDSGVAPVPALQGHLADGTDLSADARVDALAGLDAFGHGTHLAGVIAAVAPQSRIVSVKVADHEGNTSLVRLLAGLDWVARNADRDGRSIRVVNLAFGAEPGGSYHEDPLAFAVERAWKRGLTVVVAAGNGGEAATSLDSPAYDPYVIAAGAEDTARTADRSDDTIAEFSSRGSADRAPDVVAPGVAIVSARVPGSYLDDAFPQARIGQGHFRGSGTSQAAAVVSGAAALVAGARPGLSPDEVKALLRATAHPLAGVAADRQGRGVVDVTGAVGAAVPANAVQTFTSGRGGGPFRGGNVGVEIAVENAGSDYWTSNRWTSNRWTSNRWTSNRWTSNRWTSNRWTSNRWTGNGWAGADWSADADPAPAAP
jgi:hypothetical protein